MERCSIPENDKPVVIGYGNPLRQDDGMGWRAADLLSAGLPRGAAEISHVQQLTPELAARLEHASVVVFLDASLNQGPGRVCCHRIRPQKLPSWVHHVLPGELLTFAEQINGFAPPAFLITGGVEGIEFCDCLTQTGEMCATKMAILAQRILGRFPNWPDCCEHGKEWRRQTLSS